LGKKSAKSIGAIPASVLIRTTCKKSSIVKRWNGVPGDLGCLPHGGHLTAGPRNAGQVLKERGRQAAVRFAVDIGEDSRMQLQLHGLPASADTLSRKPTFRG